MNREQVPGLKVELSGALGADEPVHFQRLFAVGVVTGGGRFWSQFLEYLVGRFVACGLLEPSQFVSTLVRISHDVRPSRRRGLFTCIESSSPLEGTIFEVFHEFVNACQKRTTCSNTVFYRIGNSDVLFRAVLIWQITGNGFKERFLVLSSGLKS